MKTFKLGLLTLICVGMCDFAFSSEIPIKFKNDSGIDDKNIYIQIIVQGVGFWDFDKSKWNKTDGLEAASVTLAGIKDKEYTVKIDDLNGSNNGGKVYVSFGGPAPTKMDGEQYVSPIPDETTVFDKIEIGLAKNAVINQTSVDFVALPLAFQVDGSDEMGFTCRRSKLMQDMKSELEENTDFKDLLIYNGNNVVVVKNPTWLGPDTTVIDEKIKAALPKNSTFKVAVSKEKIASFTTDDDNLKYGDLTIPLNYFTSFAVFRNKIDIADPDNIGGAISAYILRGVDMSASNENDDRFADYENFTYPADPYAKVIHYNCIGKRGYAFGYDDTGAIDCSSSQPRNGKGFTIIIKDCKDLKGILKLQ